MYIFWFLHQTTTLNINMLNLLRCISFDSYIKPQLYIYIAVLAYCCISFDSYIKPQHQTAFSSLCRVVYLLIPTSNHNLVSVLADFLKLYIFWFLHQTTTDPASYLISLWLYIFWFLHQTTTSFEVHQTSVCCISFDSYIKPQQKSLWEL